MNSFVLLFVDNSAAEKALEKGFTTSRIALEIMKSKNVCRRFNFQTRRIHTSINPADNGSRGLALDKDLVLEICTNGEKYVAEGKIGPKKSEYSVRHLEPIWDGTDEELAVHLAELNFDPCSLPQTEYAGAKYGKVTI